MSTYIVTLPAKNPLIYMPGFQSNLPYNSIGELLSQFVVWQNTFIEIFSYNSLNCEVHLVGIICQTWLVKLAVRANIKYH